MAIIGFERFDIGAWISEGMVSAAPKAQQARVGGGRKTAVGKASLIVALSAVALMSFPAEPSAAALSMTLAAEPVRVTASGGNLVPDGYWPRAIAAMKSWRNVQSDVAYPDPVL